MTRTIRLNEGNWDVREKINELCSRLSEVPFNNWVYRGKKSVHKKSGDGIEEGTFSLRQKNVFYRLSKSHDKSEYRMRGACPIFHDGGYMGWVHYFIYSFRVSPQRQNTILIEGYDIDNTPIVSLYNKLDCERITIEEEKEYKIEEQKAEEKERRRRKIERTGNKILEDLCRRK